MQKILTLSPKDWITGVGVGQHLEGGGIFATADGINPFVNPLLNSADFGLLQTGKTAVDASGGVVDQVIIAFIPRSATEIYALGLGGDIYSIALVTDVPTLKKATSATSCYNGFFSKGGGTEYFYYFNGTQIGRYDLNTTAPNDFWTGLTGTIRPLHYWAQTFWFGNGATIGKLVPASLPSTGALGASNLNVLDFDPEYTTMCLSDDDYRLVIGVASQITSIIYKGQTKIYFWDGFSPSWEKEFDIPEPNIQWIKRIGNVFYAMCGRALYIFNYATPPTKILDLDTNHSTAIGNFNAVSRLGDAILWGSIDLNMYGKLNAKVLNSFSTPFSFALRASNAQSIDAESKSGTIYVGGANSKFYTISTTTGGDTSGLAATTHFIDLKDVYNIQGITIVFGLNLASGDDITIILTNRNGDSQSVSPIFTALGAIARQFYPLSLKADQVKIQFGGFNGGNPKIKDIIIYGEKISEI